MKGKTELLPIQQVTDYLYHIQSAKIGLLFVWRILSVLFSRLLLPLSEQAQNGCSVLNVDAHSGTVCVQSQR